jgi:hypothetical protein
VVKEGWLMQDKDRPMIQKKGCSRSFEEEITKPLKIECGKKVISGYGSRLTISKAFLNKVEILEK